MVIASEIARQVDLALYTIVGICLVLLAGITVAMIYLVLRYRAKRSPVARQIEGSTTLSGTGFVLSIVV